MKIPLGLRFTTIPTMCSAALIPLLVVVFSGTRYQWWGIGLVALVLVAVLVTFRGRRLGGWVAVVFAWLWSHRKPPHSASEPVVGATVMPADHVAVRWQDECLVSLIELVPRPFTPTVIVAGRIHTDDVVDTRLIEQRLLVHCPDLEADVVSAGYRIGTVAPEEVAGIYGQAIGSDPAPAHRRTWIMLRANPMRTHRSARRRDAGTSGLIRYLVASTTRIADDLAAYGVNASSERSFDDYDRATEVCFHRESWSRIKGRDSFTAAYTAAGGPDVWWSAPADHTITRVRIIPGSAPRSTVLLTTQTKARGPKGFTAVSGAQRAAMRGDTMVTDRHCQLPIGSAGVLVGETVDRCPVYLAFDDVDVSINLGDARTFTQFAVRAAAAGGMVTLQARFSEFAKLIGADIGPEAKVAWRHATTYLGEHPGLDRVILRQNIIGTPRHHQLTIRPISLRAEGRFEMALPG